MRQLFKDELLNQFANELLHNGFRILKPIENASYFHYEKYGKVGYCQSDYFGGLSFSTVHRACRECGTGFRIRSGVIEPTIQNSEEAFVFAPYEVPELKAIKKYRSLEDYLNAPTNQIIKSEIVEPMHV